MPEHSSRRPVESKGPSRPLPGRARIKMLGLLLTLALVAGQPVAKALLPDDVNDTPGHGNGALAQRSAPPVQALQAPDQDQASSSATGEGAGVVGSALGAVADLTAAAQGARTDTQAQSLAEGAGQSTQQLGQGVAGQPQPSVETEGRDRGLQAAAAPSLQEPVRDQWYLEEQPAPEPALAGSGTPSDAPSQVASSAPTDPVERVAPAVRAGQSGPLYEIASSGKQGCTPSDPRCKDPLFCQAYPTSCINGQPPSGTPGPSGPVGPGLEEPTAAPVAPPVEAPVVPPVPACVQAGGRDGDGDGVCDDQDDENHDTVADINQDIDQNGWADWAQTQMGMGAPDINGNGQDDQTEDWDHDSITNKDDTDLDGDGTQTQYDPPVPQDGMQPPSQPASATPSATPTATPAASAMPTPRPTATPTGLPTGTPVDPAASPPAATPVGLGVVGDAIVDAYDWVKDGTSYNWGQAMVEPLVSAVINLATRQRTAAEREQWVGALDPAAADRAAAAAAAGDTSYDPLIPQPEDQLLDPLLGVTVTQGAQLLADAHSPEAKELGVQLAIEVVGVGFGQVLGSVLEGVGTLVRKAFGKAGTEAIEEGAEQAIRQGDDLTAGDRAPFLPTPGVPAAPRPPAVTVRSAIGDSRYATDVAEGLSDQAQRDVNNVLNEFVKGNDNPGLGKRSLRDGYFELRGKNNGRVILKQTGPNQYDIVGKFEAHTAGADKDTRLIQRLKDEYERTHPKP